MDTFQQFVQPKLWLFFSHKKWSFLAHTKVNLIIYNGFIYYKAFAMYVVIYQCMDIAPQNRHCTHAPGATPQILVRQDQK